MESDDENLIIPPEHLNLSDEALPELHLGDDVFPGDGAGAVEGADTVPIQASGDSDAASRVKGAAAAVMDTEWDTFQMSIAR